MSGSGPLATARGMLIGHDPCHAIRFDAITFSPVHPGVDPGFGLIPK